MKKPSDTEENYLKAIYKFSKDGSSVSTNTISKYLKTTPASVTDMLKKLKEKELVDYRPYKGVTLLEAGEKIALRIIRKHRLWEVFLVKVLHFSWDAIHETAEQLEHIDSPELIERLDEFLGFPKFDPHGDPIPSSTGEFEERKTQLLSEVDPGKSVRMAGVLIHTTEFLQYLDKIGLNIGTKIEVSEALKFDQSMILIVDDRQIVVSGETARNLLTLPYTP